MNIQSIFKKINRTYVLVAFLVVCVIIIICNNFLRTPYNESFNAAPEEGVPKVQNRKPQRYQEPAAEIVLYYATWCGYSRMFLPEWEKFEKYAKGNLPHIKVSNVRCEGGNEATCSQKGVEGYPTVILYPKKGTEINFMKERTTEKLIEFVNENVKA